MQKAISHLLCVAALAAMPVYAERNEEETPTRSSHKAVRMTAEVAQRELEQHGIIPDSTQRRDFFDLRQDYDTHMRIAISNHDVEDIMLLIMAGIDINTPDHHANTYLHEAIWHYNAREAASTAPFDMLMEIPGIDVNYANDRGETPLDTAVKRGNEWCVGVLLHHPDINLSAWSPFFLAILKNDPTALRTLLKEGESPNQTAPSGKLSALHVAALLEHTECLRVLMKAPDIEFSTDEQQSTPLHAAARKGNSNCLRLLLKHPQAPINAQDAMECTALHRAISGGDASSARQLIEHKGININLQDSFGYTPLLEAAIEGHTEIVRLLLEQKEIQVNTPTKDGWTPLMAAALGNHTETVRVLLQHPDTDYNLREHDGSNVIDFAVQYRTDTLRELVALPGIDLNAGGYTSTPLQNAAEHGHSEAVRILLQAGADVHTADKYGNTALILAASGNYTECVRLLLSCPNIDVNARTEKGAFALWRAAHGGYTESVRLLVEHPEIDLHATYQSKTPLQVAEENGHAECANILRNAIK